MRLVKFIVSTTGNPQRVLTEALNTHLSAVSIRTGGRYLVVPAGGVEGVGPAGEQRLVVSRHQHFDVVVALVLKRRQTE